MYAAAQTVRFQLTIFPCAAGLIGGFASRAGDSSNSRIQSFTEHFMSLGTILLIILILVLVGALPSWPHSRSWGYGPSGLVGLIVVVLVVLLLMGRI